MVYLIVHIFIQPGQEKAFYNYEAQVLPIFKNYGGVVLGAYRPEASGNPSADEKPYEIHVLSIPSEEAFLAYRNDTAVMALKDERNLIFRKMEIFKSTESITY